MILTLNYPQMGGAREKKYYQIIWQQYQLNDPKIIESYENPLGCFYWLLHTFHVNLTVTVSSGI